MMTRMREVHDFWHVLFGCHTNVFGELAIKAVEFVQVGMGGTPLPALCAPRCRQAPHRDGGASLLN